MKFKAIPILEDIYNPRYEFINDIFSIITQDFSSSSSFTLLTLRNQIKKYDENIGETITTKENRTRHVSTNYGKFLIYCGIEKYYDKEKKRYIFYFDKRNLKGAIKNLIERGLLIEVGYYHNKGMKIPKFSINKELYDDEDRINSLNKLTIDIFQDFNKEITREFEKLKECEKTIKLFEKHMLKQEETIKNLMKELEFNKIKKKVRKAEQGTGD